MQEMLCLTAVRHRRAHWQMTRMLVDRALFGTASRDKTSDDDNNSAVWVGGLVRGGGLLCAYRLGVCGVCMPMGGVFNFSAL
jgi:hypothetical protein